MRQKILAFTLLELIVVIIVVSVLASLALPRFFRVIERSRATEALIQLKVLREAVERCTIMKGSWDVGVVSCSSLDFQSLGVDDPATFPNVHFTYSRTQAVSNPGVCSGFSMAAYRNTRERPGADPGCQNFTRPDVCGSTSTGNESSGIFMSYDSNRVQIKGCGYYAGIQQ